MSKKQSNGVGTDLQRSQNESGLVKLSVDSPWLNLNLEADAVELFKLISPLVQQVISELRKGE